MTTRLNRGFFGGLRRKRTRASRRTGHNKSIARADNTAPKTARNEPAKAKPAPGPMYARAAWGTSATSSKAEMATETRLIYFESLGGTTDCQIRPCELAISLRTIL